MKELLTIIPVFIMLGFMGLNPLGDIQILNEVTHNSYAEFHLNIFNSGKKKIHNDDDLEGLRASIYIPELSIFMRSSPEIRVLDRSTASIKINVPIPENTPRGSYLTIITLSNDFGKQKAHTWLTVV